jgi:hypothetical protein
MGLTVWMRILVSILKRVCIVCCLLVCLALFWLQVPLFRPTLFVQPMKVLSPASNYFYSATVTSTVSSNDQASPTPAGSSHSPDHQKSPSPGSPGESPVTVYMHYPGH